MGAAATVLLFSSSEVVGVGVGAAAGAGTEVRIEAGAERGLLSLLVLPLLSTTVGGSLSFLLLSVLTIGWSYGPGLAQSCEVRIFIVNLHC